MKNGIILHGKPGEAEYYDMKYPSPSNMHWIPWLQKALITHNIFAQTPDIPYAFKPDYEVWKREFERYDITPETVLVGHSCGGGFLVRWLSENKDKKVGKVVLVAPWIDPKREKAPEFFDFEIDGDIINRVESLTIYNSDDDKVSIQESVKILQEKIPGIKIRDFHNYGHFTYSDMKTFEFKELLEALV